MRRHKPVNLMRYLLGQDKKTALRARRHYKSLLRRFGKPKADSGEVDMPSGGAGAGEKAGGGAGGGKESGVGPAPGFYPNEDEFDPYD